MPVSRGHGSGRGPPSGEGEHGRGHKRPRSQMSGGHGGHQGGHQGPHHRVTSPLASSWSLGPTINIPPDSRYGFSSPRGQHQSGRYAQVRVRQQPASSADPHHIAAEARSAPSTLPLPRARRGVTTEIVWRGNTVLPISPPAGSLLCPRNVVTNVFCHLTFAEQRETAGAWLARLCDPAPGQATVGSCCPRSHAPRAALMGPHSNQGHLKLPGHLPSPRHQAAVQLHCNGRF